MEFKNFGKVLELLGKESVTDKQAIALIETIKVQWSKQAKETVEISTVSGVKNE